MDILLTNYRLTSRGGTEAIIRDLTLALIARGHRAAVYSSVAPPQDNSLAEDGVPFVTDLDDLTFSPDVIHAHHRVDTMAALVALPGVPAVYCCHGATRSDAQPRHPRIIRYTAITPWLKLRMAIESGIPEDLIEVVYNAVDTLRFSRIRTPPARPRRALVFNRLLVESTPVGRAIREAAVRHGLELSFLRAMGDGSTIERPQDELLEYDIVFAAGKSAIDAMACGCAVVVVGGAAGGWGPTGCGEMVTPDNLERLRISNFTTPVNSPIPSSLAIARQIERYSAGTIAEVTMLIRDVANFDRVVDQYLDIYARVIASKETAMDARAERQAAYDYLRSLCPWVRLGEENQMLSDLLDAAGRSSANPALSGAILLAGIARELNAIDTRVKSTGEL